MKLFRFLAPVALLLLSLTVQAQSKEEVKPQVKEVVKTGETTVELRFSDGQTRLLDFYGPAVVRLFQDPAGGPVRDPKADPDAKILVENPRAAVGDIRVEKTGAAWLVRTSALCLTVASADGTLSASSVTADGDKAIVKDMTFDIASRGVNVTVPMTDGECFYGGGMQNGRFSHAGKIIQIVNQSNWTDGGVSSPTPFYWSSAGYGVMFYTFKPGRYDFGATEKGQVMLNHDTSYLDLFLMVDDYPMAAFWQLTGYPVMLPKFGFYEGHLNAYNRDYWTETEEGGLLFEDGKRYKESQKSNGGIRESLNGEVPDSLGRSSYQFSARAVIDRYAAHDMPLGWILPNDGYATGYGQTGTVDGNIENLRQFGEYAHSKGVEIGLWTQSDLHPKEGVEALLQRDIIREVRDAGVRALKTDVAWVGAGYSFGLNGVSDVGTIMPQYGNDARPFIITCDGWAGTQRYAGLWSGDQTGGQWEYIRFHIPTYIGSGLSGQPNVGSDMDGIFGGKNLPVNVRDFQWKTFTPLQLNMDGWGSNEKYPHALGPVAEKINRRYLKMKASLMPYLYSVAHEACAGGLPIVRAMSLDGQQTTDNGQQTTVNGQQTAVNRQQVDDLTKYQFLCGPWFLVAPIYQETKMDKEGNDIRNGIYLPQGDWYDYWTGDGYVSDGTTILNNYPAPLYKLPLFVKGGAIIPMTAPHNQPRDVDPFSRLYDLWPNGDSEFTQYDDDGATQAYLQGECVTTRLEMKASPFTLTIHPSEGHYEGFVKDKRTVLSIHQAAMPKSVTVKVNGRKCKGVTYAGTPDGKVLTIDIPALDVTATTIVVTLKGFQPTSSTALAAGEPVAKAALASVPTPTAEATAYTIKLQWDKVKGAEYYDILFNGMHYTGISDTQLLFENLQPETTYPFVITAMKKGGEASAPTAFEVTTEANPLEWAIQGIKATTSCENQDGQGIRRLFDFDESTVWHTKWGEKATPFTMDIDLGCTIQPDKLQYLPRVDAGNGTLLEGTIAVSTDGQQWSQPHAFQWAADSEVKEIDLDGQQTTDNEQQMNGIRYLRMEVTRGRGDFGSGRQLYIFRKPGSEVLLPGDINRDGRVDMDDFTSYMNYMGLRTGDPEFEGYVSSGDVDHNGRIDVYDISVVATQVQGGVEPSMGEVAGTLDIVPTPSADAKGLVTLKAGQTLTLTVSGKDLREVNAFGFALPYSAADLEYVATEPVGTLAMENLTNDRLHANGDKVLYPVFVNTGDAETLSADGVLCRITFRARRACKVSLKPQDVQLVDKMLNRK